MLNNKNLSIPMLLIGYMTLGLIPCVQAGEEGQYFTSVMGEKIAMSDVEKALDIGPESLVKLSNKVKQSDLDGKIKLSTANHPLARQKPWFSVQKMDKGLIELNPMATNQPGCMHFHGLNVFINPQVVASSRALRAIGLHEQHHLNELHPFRNRYYDEHDRSTIKSSVVGIGTGLLPITFRMLRRTCQSKLPLKGAILLGTGSFFVTYKALEHQKILNRRSQEVSADEFMLRESTIETTKGALEQLACNSVTTRLRLANQERALQKQFSFMSPKLINAYAVNRSNWYREHELEGERLKRIVRSSIGSQIPIDERRALVKEVMRHLGESGNLKKLSTKYSLSVKQVKNIVAMAHESCVKAVS
jgi:hypothetical protein